MNQAITESFNNEPSTLQLSHVYHDVLNMLQCVSSLIMLHTARDPKRPLDSIASKLQQRILTLSQVYSTLAATGAVQWIECYPLLTQVLATIKKQSSQPSHFVIWNNNIEDIKVPIKYGAPLSLITYEWVTNALQHAKPIGNELNITVELEQIDRGLLLQISDNGLCIGDDIEVNNASTMGFQLVELLAQQLNATISTSNADGCLMCLSVPLNTI